MKSTVSEKGQVTIPQKIRDLLGLKAGQVLEFEAKGGVLIGRKAVSTQSLEEVTGILSEGVKDVDRHLDNVRGPFKK